MSALCGQVSGYLLLFATSLWSCRLPGTCTSSPPPFFAQRQVSHCHHTSLPHSAGGVLIRIQGHHRWFVALGRHSGFDTVMTWVGWRLPIAMWLVAYRVTFPDQEWVAHCRWTPPRAAYSAGGAVGHKFAGSTSRGFTNFGV